MKSELRWFKKPGQIWHLIAKNDKNFKDAFTHQEFKKMIKSFIRKEQQKFRERIISKINKYQRSNNEIKRC